MCPSERKSREYSLIFPTKRDGTVSISNALSRQMSAWRVIRPCVTTASIYGHRPDTESGAWLRDLRIMTLTEMVDGTRSAMTAID